MITWTSSSALAAVPGTATAMAAAASACKVCRRVKAFSARPQTRLVGTAAVQQQGGLADDL